MTASKASISIALACVSKFSSGCVYYYRNFHVANNPSIAKKFKVDFK